MYQKHQISLPVGYKTARPKAGDWERLWRQFRTPSLAKNRFLRRFLIFSEPTRYCTISQQIDWLTIRKWLRNRSSPSLLFLVSRFCIPPEVKFDAFGTSKHGEGKSLSKNFFCYTYQHIGRFNRAKKKKSVIYTLMGKRDGAWLIDLYEPLP